MKRFAIALAFVLPAVCASTAADGKKCLAFGWEFRHRMSVQDLIAAAPWFNQTPIDGVEIHLRMKTPEGQSFGSQEFMDGPAWTEENCAETAKDLKRLSVHKAFRASFINTIRAPSSRIDWRDDRAWARIAENMRIAAMLARDALLPGLAIDPEDYSKCWQFFRMPGDPAYSELTELARRRGAEIVRGAFAEYPRLTLFFYWFMSFQEKYTVWNDSIAAARDRGDLWPAFLNGVLDAMPPGARIVDGDENAYRYAAEDFPPASVHWREGVLDFVAPENRAKYRAQVEISSGHYLDEYVNGPESRYYQPPLDGSRLKRLVSNFAAARQSAREYVWFWGEKYTWVNWPGSIALSKGCFRETWDQRLVGLSEALAAVAAPASYFAAQLRKPTASLIPLQGGLPIRRSTWQKENGRQGVFSAAQGELRMVGMERGSYSVAIGDIEPGHCYCCTCEATGPGVSLTIRWKKVDGKWHPLSSHGAFAGDDVSAWRRGTAIARAPTGATTLVLQLAAERQSACEQAAFRNVEARILRDFHESEITEWNDLLAGVKSSLDSTVQPFWFWAPENAKTEAVPLVVGLHTWGGSYRQLSHYRTVLNYAKTKGWAFVGSNFRGPNMTPFGCGSDLAVQDVVDQIDYAKKRVKIDAGRIYIIGGSGGGHMSLLMTGRHPEIFAAAAAFCPIVDIAQWWRERSAPGAKWRNYAENVVAVCGGTPAERAEEFAKRSPLTHLPKAKSAGVPVYIVTGIHDGHVGSVPVGHALRAFNTLADSKDVVSDEEIDCIERDERIPCGMRNEDCTDPFYGADRKVLFRRTSGNVRVTLFNGGHGGNFSGGLDFLARQVKGRPADWTLPATSDDIKIEALGK